MRHLMHPAEVMIGMGSAMAVSPVLHSMMADTVIRGAATAVFAAVGTLLTAVGRFYLVRWGILPATEGGKKP